MVCAQNTMVTRLLIYVFVVILVSMSNAMLGQKCTIAVELLINEDSLDTAEQTLARHAICVSPYLSIAWITNVWLQKIKERKENERPWWGGDDWKKKRVRDWCPLRGMTMTYRTSSHLWYNVGLDFSPCLFISVSLVLLFESPLHLLNGILV